MTIRFSPSKKQKIAWEYLMDKHTLYIGYGGAAFCGKSYLECHWLNVMAHAYPETSYGLGRNELVTLKKTTLLTLFKVFAECNMKPNVDYSYNQQLNTITYTNGSIIFLIDMAYYPSDPLYTRFGGLELTAAAVDESAESDYRGIEILFTRLGRKNNHKYGIAKKLLETFNPAKNHVFSRYVLPYEKGILSDKYAFVPALPSDNPSPEVEEYVKGILATGSQVTIQRLIYGNFHFDDDPKALIIYSAIQDLFYNKHIVREGNKYLIADIAMQGADQFVIGVWHGWALIELCRFPKMDGKQVEDKIIQLQRAHSIPNSRTLYDADGLGAYLDGYLRGAIGFKNGAKALNEENYANLKTQCYYRLADKVNKGEMFLECVRDTAMQDLVKQELAQVKSLDADKDSKLKMQSKEVTKQNIGRSPDISDMLAYRMYFDIAKPRTVHYSINTF
jgi:phage terminase large subunit